MWWWNFLNPAQSSISTAMRHSLKVGPICNALELIVKQVRLEANDDDRCGTIPIQINSFSAEFKSVVWDYFHTKYFFQEVKIRINQKYL